MFSFFRAILPSTPAVLLGKPGREPVDGNLSELPQSLGKGQQSAALWMLNAIRAAPGWRFRSNCKVCSGSVPRSSWTGCWLQPVTPPWFITEVIVCVWFYTGDLWASRLPLHQLLSTSDAVTWARRLARCQKGTIKGIFKVFAELFVKPSQSNENTAFPQGQVLVWFLQLPSSVWLFPQ